MNTEPVLPDSYPREMGTPVYSLPLEREGPADFFPAVCLKSHWDPTQILKRTLPEQYVAQPLDPRPWTKICMEYTTAGGQEPAPEVSAGAVLPQGGQFYPPGRYSAAIDAESKLRRMDRPLGTCEADQWEPTLGSDMYSSQKLIPDRKMMFGNTSRVEELAYPKALLRSGPYECRALNDQFNVSQSSEFTFNNATKQDRYKLMKKPHKPAAPNKALQAAAERARPDLVFSASQRPEWQGPDGKLESRSYEKDAAVRRADLVAGTTAAAKEAESQARDREKAAREGGTPAYEDKYRVRSGGYLPSYAFPSQL